MIAWFGLQPSPVSDDVRSIAVDLELGDRFRQHDAMKKRALDARPRLGVEQARLEGESALWGDFIRARQLSVN